MNGPAQAVQTPEHGGTPHWALRHWYATRAARKAGFEEGEKAGYSRGVRWGYLCGGCWGALVVCLIGVLTGVIK